MKLTEGLGNRHVGFAAALVIVVFASNLLAQTQPGKAQVKAIKGSATYSVEGRPAEVLKVNTILGSGTTIKTGAGSTVDLFLGRSAGTVRIAESSTLALDKLSLTDTGADRVVEVQMNLPEGTIFGDVNKLSPASKYEIKMPSGVAGIRGTRFRISSINSTPYIVLLDGGPLIFVYVPAGGNPTPFTLVGPGVYFSPNDGIRQAPEELLREIRAQMGPPFQPPGPPAGVPFREPFVSPGTGTKPQTPR